MTIFLLPKNITQLYSLQGIYEKKEWRSIISNCPNNGRCLLPRCDSIWYTHLQRQHLCVWGFLFLLWVLLAASCELNWSEGLVKWCRFWSQSQGCNMLWDKLMGMKLLGAGNHPADAAERLPWIWASQQKQSCPHCRATSTGNLVLSCIRITSRSTVTWKQK